MKKYCTLLVVLVMASCSDQFIVEEVSEEYSEQIPKSEIEILKEKAYWGNGQACLTLADYYRDGIGVKPDYLNMINMLILAEDFGAINKVEDYFGGFPIDNELEFLSKWAKNTADKEAIQGAMAIEKGDTLLGRQMIMSAAEQGSSLAMLFGCAPSYSGIRHHAINKLIEVADKVPYAYKIMGNIYSGIKREGLKDERLAAYYYQKADLHLCLGKDGAQWLLYYYRKGGDLNLNEIDLKRLKVLSGENNQDHEKAYNMDIECK